MISNDAVKAAAPVINAPAVLSADNVGLSAAQMEKVISQKDREQELKRMVSLIVAQKGAANPQTDNIRNRIGQRPTISKRDHMTRTGGMPRQMMTPNGQLNPLTGDMDIVTQQGEETTLLSQLQSMSHQERDQFLRRLSLDRRSIYDPLPDSTEAYQINLLLGRLNTERMYTL